MKYEIAYKTLIEVANMIQNKNIFNNTEMVEDDLYSPIVFDVIIIIDNNDKIFEVLCSDKSTLDEIKKIKENSEKKRTLTKLCRCFIINHSDIVNLMNYNEFRERYNYKM